jgi:hypothetical protein
MIILAIISLLTVLKSFLNIFFIMIYHLSVTQAIVPKPALPD